MRRLARRTVRQRVGKHGQPVGLDATERACAAKKWPSGRVPPERSANDDLASGRLVTNEFCRTPLSFVDAETGKESNVYGESVARSLRRNAGWGLGQLAAGRLFIYPTKPPGVDSYSPFGAV